MKTYELGDKDGSPFIRCLVCRTKSYNRGDIDQRYCGHCHEFHERERIWLTQWLCPRRHCSIAIMWHPQQTTATDVEQEGEAVYKRGVLNRRCGICDGELAPEHRPTRYTTMDEAEREGRKIEAASLVSRLMLESVKEGSKN